MTTRAILYTDGETPHQFFRSDTTRKIPPRNHTHTYPDLPVCLPACLSVWLDLTSLHKLNCVNPNKIEQPPEKNEMVVAFDKCETRPAHIDAILSGLDRYNPETTTIFQDYISQQCEERTFDCYANLALLKLYVSPPPVLNVFVCVQFGWPLRGGAGREDGAL